jgi:hypothetical protein
VTSQVSQTVVSIPKIPLASLEEKEEITIKKLKIMRSFVFSTYLKAIQKLFSITGISCFLRTSWNLKVNSLLIYKVLKKRNLSSMRKLTKLWKESLLSSI